MEFMDTGLLAGNEVRTWVLVWLQVDFYIRKCCKSDFYEIIVA